MKNKRNCLNSRTSCFTGLCINCNKVVKVILTKIHLNSVGLNKIIGTFCKTCRHTYCVCGKKIDNENT